MFFNDHPRFLETSHVGATRPRLNARHRAIVDQNAKILRGARVLDIAAHDGRWTLAALTAGAGHVTGVEARPELTARAVETMDFYGADRERYEIVTSDIFDYLRGAHSFDVVMCLGFFYHTLRFPEVLTGIQNTGAAHVILDTKVLPAEGNIIRMGVDKVHGDGAAAEDEFGHDGMALTGTPSPSALRKMFSVYGFDVTHEVNWKSLIARRGSKGPADYLEGRRVTWRLTRNAVG